MRNTLRFLPMLFLLVLAGCEVPAQIYWSPDGTRAAYVPTAGSESAAALIDEQGKVLAALGKSVGGFAWSADSKQLYYAAVGPKPAVALAELRNNWSNVQPKPADV